MTQQPGAMCSVCGLRDERALVQFMLEPGTRVTLCGSHAIMHDRSSRKAQTASELRELLRDKRQRGDRRSSNDELAAALTAAFSADRRSSDRRRD